MNYFVSYYLGETFGSSTFEAEKTDNTYFRAETEFESNFASLILSNIASFDIA